MTIDRAIANGFSLLIAAVMVNCSSDSEQTRERWSPEESRREIATTLEETATRWHYGDKAILYEQEFEYIQVEYTYDKYLEIDQIKNMVSDTVNAFVVKDVRFFEGDSARVQVDVVFVGPAGVETVYPQEWTMFYHRGRWIRPSLSHPTGQIEFEERRRKADSAARAEENEVW